MPQTFGGPMGLREWIDPYILVLSFCAVHDCGGAFRFPLFAQDPPPHRADRRRAFVLSLYLTVGAVFFLGDPVGESFPENNPLGLRFFPPFLTSASFSVFQPGSASRPLAVFQPAAPPQETLFPRFACFSRCRALACLAPLRQVAVLIAHRFVPNEGRSYRFTLFFYPYGARSPSSFLFHRDSFSPPDSQSRFMCHLLNALFTFPAGGDFCRRQRFKSASSIEGFSITPL